MFRTGFTSLLVIGLVGVIVLIAFIVYGPFKVVNFGQLGSRQEQQISQAGGPASIDSDNDGFSKEIEDWVETDPEDNCPDNGTDAVWPPDINNDKKVDQKDIDAFKPHFMSKVGSILFDKRFDLNGDNRISSIDVEMLNSYLGTTCSN